MQIEFPASPLTAPWIAFGQSVARETQATAFQSYERWHALFFGALGAGETRPEPQEKPAPKAKPVQKAALAKPIEPATAEEPKVAAAKVAAKPMKIVMKSAPAPKVEAPTTALKAVAKPAPVVARVPEPAAAKLAVVAPLALVPRPVEAVVPVLVAPAAVATPALPAKTVPAKAALAAVAPAVSEEATSVMIPLPLRNAPKAEKPAKSGSKVVLMLDASEIDPAGTFDDAKVTKVEPLYLAKPDGKADDLKKIKGIGATLERLLNDLGLWHYRQIAALTPGEIAWVNSKIDFKGRVQRDKWVSQARTLLG